MNYKITNVKIETGEDGFSLIIDGEHEFAVTQHVFDVQDVAEQLYDEVTGMIGPWLKERDAAKREWHRRPYPLGDWPDESESLRDHAFRTAEMIADMYDQEKDR